jgi:RimJ/RimL family protein N-acetyltransferase
MSENPIDGRSGKLPDRTIETFARAFFRESSTYGFSQSDYLRFINRLLDLSMSAGGDAAPRPERLDAPPQVALHTLPLCGDQVRVRAFERDRDMDLLAGWIEDEFGRHFLMARTMSRMLTLEDVVDDPSSIVGIVTLPEGVPIGATAFLHVDVDQRMAELRKLIGEPSMRGRGYGKAASRLWIGYGLLGLKLHKIYLSTLNTHLRNIQLNEDLGFRVEGILHDEVLLDGKYYDVLRMAICQSERGGPRLTDE